MYVMLVPSIINVIINCRWGVERVVGKKVWEEIKVEKKSGKEKRRGIQRGDF